MRAIRLSIFSRISRCRLRRARHTSALDGHTRLPSHAFVKTPAARVLLYIVLIDTQAAVDMPCRENDGMTRQEINMQEMPMRSESYLRLF